MVRLRHFLQQPQRLLPAQLHLHAPHRPHRVLSSFVIHRQPTQLAPLLLPIAGFRLHLCRCRILSQTLAPALERTRPCRQLQLLASPGLPIRGLQVFQQNAPRHAVHYQVMHRQQQPRPSLSTIKEHYSQHWSGSDIQTRLHRRRLCFQRCTLPLCSQMTEVHY